MNILGFISAILLILSFTFYACVEKQNSLWKIHRSFANREEAGRNLLLVYEKDHYKSIRGASKKSPESPKLDKEPSPPKKPKKPKEEVKEEESAKINPECARLDLRPLIEKEKSADPLLYETLAELLRLFYKKPLLSFLSSKADSEYQFLDAWLAALKRQLGGASKGSVLLEKAAFQDPSFQSVYYHMLRGGKENYPCLLDLVKVSFIHGKRDSVCLQHATPLMLSIFFGSAAQAIYQEFHSTPSSLKDDAMIDLVRRNGGPACPKELFSFINLSKSSHKSPSTTTLLQEDEKGDIAIRQKIRKLNKKATNLSQKNSSN